MAEVKYRDIGHQRLTVSTVAVSLPSIPAGAECAFFRVKGTGGDGLCYRADGTNPTNSTGMELEVGEGMFYDANLTGFKAIRRNSADVVLVIQYLRQLTG